MMTDAWSVSCLAQVEVSTKRQTTDSEIVWPSICDLGQTLSNVLNLFQIALNAE